MRALQVGGVCMQREGVGQLRLDRAGSRARTEMPDKPAGLPLSYADTTPTALVGRGGAGSAC